MRKIYLYYIVQRLYLDLLFHHVVESFGMLGLDLDGVCHRRWNSDFVSHRWSNDDFVSCRRRRIGDDFEGVEGGSGREIAAATTKSARAFK